MTDFKQSFSDEVRRLARKEIKRELSSLRESILFCRKTITELNRRVKVLESVLVEVPEPSKDSVTAETLSRPVSCHLTPEKILKIRMKLKLTQQEMAKLLEVSQFSVSNWENGKSKPRLGQKRKIAALRNMGKREFAKFKAEKLAGATVVQSDANSAEKPEGQFV